MNIKSYAALALVLTLAGTQLAQAANETRVASVEIQSGSSAKELQGVVAAQETRVAAISNHQAAAQA